MHKSKESICVSYSLAIQVFHIALPDYLNLQTCLFNNRISEGFFKIYMHIWTIIWLNWINILMHVAWDGNKFDQLFILSLAYCFPFYTPQTSLKISLTKLHRPPSCNKSWRRRQSKCSETWIEDNFFSEPWLQDVCQYASKHRNHPWNLFENN